MGIANHGAEIPRPYADVDPEEIEKALDRTAVAGAIYLKDTGGREVIIPPQSEPRSEETGRSNPVVPQQIRSYDVYEAYEDEE